MTTIWMTFSYGIGRMYFIFVFGTTFKDELYGWSFGDDEIGVKGNEIKKP